MRLDDFAIGCRFSCADRLFQCTDVGSRTVAAVLLTPTISRGGSETILTPEQIEEDGWLNGPPYALDETIFDEDDILVCTLVAPAPSHAAGRREQAIAAMSMELEKHEAFTGNPTKALVWATRLYEAAEHPSDEPAPESSPRP